MHVRPTALALALIVPALSMFPSVALADLILVEDDRFIEVDQDGEVTRREPPGSLSWDWTARIVPGPFEGGPAASQQTTLSGTTLSASGGTFLTLDGGVSQESHATFDVLFRVDRPTFISLSGRHREPPRSFSYAWTARVLFMEDSTLLLSGPTENIVDAPFSLVTILKPESTYRLFVEGSVLESDPTGGIDVFQDWSFTLEVPELPAIVLLPMVLVAAALCGTPADHPATRMRLRR